MHVVYVYEGVQTEYVCVYICACVQYVCVQCVHEGTHTKCREGMHVVYYLYVGVHTEYACVDMCVHVCVVYMNICLWCVCACMKVYIQSVRYVCMWW